MLPNDVAALLGFALETLLYGAYTVLFALSVHFLLRRRTTPHLNVPMLAATLALFACCSAHWGLELAHYVSYLWAAVDLESAALGGGGGNLNGTAAIGELVAAGGGVLGFADETRVLQGADMMISICDFVGDIVLLYRCWLVWGRNYAVVLLPFLTALGGLGCIAAVLRLLESLDPTSPTPPAAIVPLGLAGYALPLVTNALITGLIVYRIWSSSRDARAVSRMVASSNQYVLGSISVSRPGAEDPNSTSRIDIDGDADAKDTLPSPTSGSTGMGRHRFISFPFSLLPRARHPNAKAPTPTPAKPRRSRRSSHDTAAQIHSALIIIVESGLLYLATQLVFVVLFALGHPAQAVVAVMAVQIYGIAPTLILFRVALGLTPAEGTGYVTTNGHIHPGHGGGHGHAISSGLGEWARRAATPTTTTQFDAVHAAESNPYGARAGYGGGGGYGSGVGYGSGYGHGSDTLSGLGPEVQLAVPRGFLSHGGSGRASRVTVPGSETVGGSVRSLRGHVGVGYADGDADGEGDDVDDGDDGEGEEDVFGRAPSAASAV